MTSADTQGSLVCVFGVSGVGKSSLIREFIRTHRDWESLTASEILAKRTGETPEELRTASRESIVSNQRIIADQVRELRRTSAATNWLVDAHSVIDNDRELVAVPQSTVAALQPARLVFVRDQPAAIAERRVADSTRSRPQRSPGELRSEQDFAFSVCRDYAAHLNLLLFEVESTDVVAFAAAVIGRRRKEES